LTEFKYVIKKDVDQQINVSKTSILPKGVTVQTVFDESQNLPNVLPKMILHQWNLRIP
jgi:hypothetical protein